MAKSSDKLNFEWPILNCVARNRQASETDAPISFSCSREKYSVAEIGID